MINIHYSRLPGLPASRAARPGNPARLSRALAEDIDLLNLPAKRPRDPKDLMFLCAGKAIGESNMKLADEQKVVDNLPTYDCDNPDDMSFRLYDGELNVIMRKLNDVNIKIVEYSSVLAAIGQQVCAIQVCSQQGRRHGFESGGTNSASGARRKFFFDPPTFWPVRGKYCLDR